MTLPCAGWARSPGGALTRIALVAPEPDRS